MSDFVEQLRALDDLHRSGGLSDAEFRAAKSRLLAGGQAPDVAAPLFLQNEVARIDREWGLEREKYLVRGRYSSSTPRGGEGTQAGVVTTVFGVIWLGFAGFIASGATSSGAPGVFWVFPLFGLFFIAAGLSKAGEMTRKSEAYLVAERNYQTRRAAAVNRLEASN